MSDRLLDVYDAILLDLDGTVFRGTEPVPGAPRTVNAIRQAGKAVRFVTNNAQRSAAEVAEHLAGLGIPAQEGEVCTSAQVAAAMLADRLPEGAVVLVVGTESLAGEVRRVGLRPVHETSPEVAAVVQGLSREIGWRELSEAVLAVRAGALWVACNIDATQPTERGDLIGNGALVAAVATATNATPLVAGKPNRPLLDQASRSANAERPLMVGDRLDTDIEGAAAAELDALLVLSGSARPMDLLRSHLRPRYVAPDMTALAERAEELEVGAKPEWGISDGRVRWVGSDGRRPDSSRLLRALCAAQVSEPRAEDDISRAALAELGLADRLA